MRDSRSTLKNHTAHGRKRSTALWTSALVALFAGTLVGWANPGDAVSPTAGSVVGSPVGAATAPRYASSLHLSGHYPIAFIRCDFTKWRYEPNSTAFYQKEFTQQNPRGHFSSLADYFHDESYGKMDLGGSAILGWYHIKISPLFWDEGGGDNNFPVKWLSCINAAEADGLGSRILKYKSLVVLTPLVNVKLTSPIPAQPKLLRGQKTPAPVTAKVDHGASLPPTPFVMDLPNQNPGENVEVTGVSGNTITLVRGYQNGGKQLKGPFAAVPVGTQVDSETSNDTANVGPQTYYLQDNDQNCANSNALCPLVMQAQPTGQYTTMHVGQANLGVGLDNSDGTAMEGVGNSAHEVAHTMGYNHSRALSTSTTDYNDCFDQMSYQACGLGPLKGLAGPPDGIENLDAIDLAYAGWVPTGSQFNAANRALSQSTITLHALSDPGALKSSGYLDAHIPAAVQIENVSPSKTTPPPTIPPTCSAPNFQCVNSRYYTVEYRQQYGFDADLGVGKGASAGAVVLHLYAPDPSFNNVSYQVDTQPGAGRTGHPVFLPSTQLLCQSIQVGCGAFQPGQDYADPAHHTYVAVNAFHHVSRSATVTVSSTPITPTLTLTGPASGIARTSVSLNARLTVGGAPVPGQSVRLTAGLRQSCKGKTNASGDVSCKVTLGGTRLMTPRSGTFSGDKAYASAAASSTFAVWSAPSVVPAVQTQTAPAMAATGGTIYEAFRQPSTGNVFIESNAGSGWSTSVQVPGATTPDAPAIALDSSGIPYVAWTDGTTGDVEVSHWFIFWSSPLVLGQGSARSDTAPSIGWANNTLYAAWKGKTSDNVWYSQGTGLTWSAQTLVPKAVTPDTPAIGSYVASGAPLIVAWTTSTHTLKYTDLTLAGWTKVATIPGGSDAGPSLGFSASNPTTYLAWKGTNSNEIYYSSTTGSGWTSEVTVPRSVTLTSPAIAFSNAALFASWTAKSSNTLDYSSAAYP
jgi:hypothetical protein